MHEGKTGLKQYALFDSHFHIIDPRFPLTANQGYLPDTFNAQDYLKRVSNYHLVGGAIVSGSFQAFDQSYLIAALAELGAGFVGVTQLPITVNDVEIIRLDRAGIQAVRFNLYRGGSEQLQYLASMAQRVYELAGWHIELYMDSKDLPQLSSTLQKLPKVSIDHLGLSKEGLPYVLKLAEQGTHVKATGFSRVNLDARAAIRDIYSANPHALMFGTDLPSTRAPTSYSDDDFLSVATTLLEYAGEQAVQQVFSLNALKLYQPDKHQH
jgi:predicted TIM-barrel fold metal-dependent hydrolase